MPSKKSSSRSSTILKSRPKGQKLQRIKDITKSEEIIKTENLLQNTAFQMAKILDIWSKEGKIDEDKAIRLRVLIENARIALHQLPDEHELKQPAEQIIREAEILLSSRD